MHDDDPLGVLLVEGRTFLGASDDEFFLPRHATDEPSARRTWYARRRRQQRVEVAVELSHRDPQSREALDKPPFGVGVRQAS
jgi:hypothetical protein